MTNSNYAPLPGSRRAPLAAAQTIGPVEADQRIELTLLLRRRAELPSELVTGPATITQPELAQRYGADPADLRLVRETMDKVGVKVIDEHAGSRRVRIAGPAGVLSELFGAELHTVRSPNPTGGPAVQHRVRTGELRLPAELDGVVLAVLGLDTRPQATTHLRPLADTQSANASYDPPTLGAVYGFPPETDGSGQTIAIVELGGGFTKSDLDAYFQGLGMATPNIQAVEVAGGTNTPGQDGGADGEVLLDIEVIGALAPKANVLVYFAPNTDQGFAEAISAAIHATPTPVACSISWGQSEDQWTAQARTAMDEAFADAAALGVTVTAAAGDNGSGDGSTDGKAHVDYPASSPNALGCGGTSLRVSTSGAVTSETVWNDGANGAATGGGVSDVYPLPDWQRNAGVGDRDGGAATGRGVPDVAGDADPLTGYQVRVDGKAMVIGGTSAVAPLWAALVSRLVQAAGKRIGLAQPLLYKQTVPGQATVGLRDITVGNNGVYQAGAGWDACTGLGVPDGAALLRLLREWANAAGH